MAEALTFGEGSATTCPPAFNRADYREFVGAATPWSLFTLGPYVGPAGLSAHVSLIHLDDARKQRPFIHHSPSDSHDDVPSCLLVEVEVAGQTDKTTRFSWH